jgi:hypothetical protein
LKLARPHVMLYSNVAAAPLAQAEGVRAVECCDKGRDLAPDNAKVSSGEVYAFLCVEGGGGLLLLHHGHPALGAAQLTRIATT